MGGAEISFTGVATLGLAVLTVATVRWIYV
jgi:hypothetical protein